MKDIDSVLYLMSVILAVDGLTQKENNFLKHNIFDKLEKAHLHVELSPQKKAFYLKYKISEVISDIHAEYEAKTSTDNFQIPESVKKNCIKHIEHLKGHTSKADLETLIQETIMIDGIVSQQEKILHNFLSAEMDKIMK